MGKGLGAKGAVGLTKPRRPTSKLLGTQQVKFLARAGFSVTRKIVSPTPPFWWHTAGRLNRTVTTEGMLPSHELLKINYGPYSKLQGSHEGYPPNAEQQHKRLKTVCPCDGACTVGGTTKQQHCTTRGCRRMKLR